MERMARLENGKTYILKTVEYSHRWNPETQEDSPPPEKTTLTVYKDENSYVKKEMPVDVEISEGSAMLIVEVKTARNGKRLVMAIWSGFGGWAEINPANWQLFRSVVYTKEEKEALEIARRSLIENNAKSEAENNGT